MNRDPGLALRLVRPELDLYLAEVEQALSRGLRGIVLPRPRPEPGGSLSELTTALRQRFGGLPFVEADAEDARSGSQPFPCVHVVAPGEASRVTPGLLSLLDLRDGTVIAPHDERRGLRQPLFLVSIPKAGTHLLMQLAEALGFEEGGAHEGDVSPGRWYYVEYSNAHTSASDFFIDSVRRSPFGNRNHPALSAPILFNYRYPPDVLLAEAYYYQREGKSPLAGYLAPLKPEERLLRLVDDPFLLGSFRDRLACFVAWLEFGNVIPVSFEEMVGSAAGGCDEARRRLVWSLLLKLEVAGDVEQIVAALSRRESPTFREGRVGRSRSELSAAVRAALAAQPQDVMQAFGYPALDGNGESRACGPLLSSRVEEFRRRPLVLPPGPSDDVPILVETDYFGFNIVRFRRHYFGLSLAAGPLDLASLQEPALWRVPNHTHLSGLRQRLVRTMLLEDETFVRDLRRKLGMR